jgi:hypothetical protein
MKIKNLEKIGAKGYAWDIEFSDGSCGEFRTSRAGEGLWEIRKDKSEKQLEGCCQWNLNVKDVYGKIRRKFHNDWREV